MVFDLKETFGFSEAEEDSLYAVIEGVFDEYPGELVSLGLNVDSFDQNHDTNVSVAHVQAQDSYWIDFYKQQKGELISKVPLRSNAEFFCIDTIDINEMLVRNESKGSMKVIDMSGSAWEESNIDFCEKGYAVGYYHYATYERSRAYFPACYDYFTHMYSHSNDIWHRVAIYIWHYTSNNSEIAYRKSVKVVDEKFNGDADVFEPRISKKVDPESSRLSDLTNSTWKIVEINHSFSEKNIDFTANGMNFKGLYSAVGTSPTSQLANVLYYKQGDYQKAGWQTEDANKISWMNNNYSIITIIGGDDVKNPELIEWLYQNAILLS